MLTIYINDPRGLAPKGFHIPSDNEWSALITFLGGEDIAGGKMKEEGTKHWKSHNADASNSSGFSGLPSGFRYNIAAFFQIGCFGAWWSSLENDTTNAWFRLVDYSDGAISRFDYTKTYGFSVRCLRD